jgi:hypothetical protein
MVKLAAASVAKQGVAGAPSGARRASPGGQNQGIGDEAWPPDVQDFGSRGSAASCSAPANDRAIVRRCWPAWSSIVRGGGR